MAGVPSRPGQANVAGGATANFLKVFANEVLMAYKDINVMEDIVQVRTISSGKQAQFVNTGKAGATYHAAGANIIETPATTQIASNERLINIDNRLISAVLLDNLDEAMSHWDARSVYATEMGRALAKALDRLALNTALLTARAASNLTAGGGTAIASGASVTDANLLVSGTSVINSLFSAAQILDQNDIPKEDRYAVVTPAMFYNLIRDPTVQLLYQSTATNAIIQTAPSFASTTIQTGTNPQIQSNYPGVMQGLFNWGSGTIRGAAVAGFTVLVSNHLPNGVNIASGDAFFGTGAASANGNVYYGNFTTTAGVCFHRSALGVVKLRDLAVESDYKIEYQGTLLVAKVMLGMGSLRPEAAIELKTA